MRRDSIVDMFDLSGEEDDLWMDRGLCRGADVNLFVPIVPHRGLPADTDEARDICRHCPVRDECLAFALPLPRLLGVWGGTDEKDRRLLRREARLREHLS